MSIVVWIWRYISSLVPIDALGHLCAFGSLSPFQSKDGASGKMVCEPIGRWAPKSSKTLQDRIRISPCYLEILYIYIYIYTSSRYIYIYIFLRTTNTNIDTVWWISNLFFSNTPHWMAYFPWAPIVSCQVRRQPMPQKVRRVAKGCKNALKQRGAPKISRGVRGSLSHVPGDHCMSMRFSI